MNKANPRVALPPTITLSAWDDPAAKRWGHDMRSVYVETYWLPILGPTSVWLARRLAMVVQAADHIDIDMADLALSHGLQPDLGAMGALAKSWRRLVDFGVIRGSGTSYEARTHMPALDAKGIARLPAFLRELHASQKVAAR